MPRTKKEDTPKHVLTDAERADILKEAASLKDEADSAHGAYRAYLKTAKKQGMLIGAITEALAVRRQAPEKFADRLKELTKNLRLLDYPLKYQFDMFGDNEPPQAGEAKPTRRRAPTGGRGKGSAGTQARKPVQHVLTHQEAIDQMPAGYASHTPEAFVAGFQRQASDDALLSDCPYPESSAEAQEWQRGFVSAQRDADDAEFDAATVPGNGQDTGDTADIGP